MIDVDTDDATYVTIAEAAKLLGVHPNTVRNRVKAGLIPATKVLTSKGEAYAIPRKHVAPLQDPLQNLGRLYDPNRDPHTLLASFNHAQNDDSDTLTVPTNGPLQGGSQQLTTLFQHLMRPLIEENARLHEMARDQAQELGRTQEQRDQARRELADLRAQLAHVQAAPPISPAPQAQDQAQPIVPPPRPRSALGSLMTALARRLG